MGGPDRVETDLDLDQLAVAAAGGDVEAGDDLIRYCYESGFLRHAIARVLFTNTDAEDALQDTLLAISRSLDRYDPAQAGFRTWATAIARNKAIDHLRRASSRPRTDGIDSPGELDAAAGLSEAQRFSSVLAIRLDLDQVLAALPDKLGIVVKMRDVEHRSYREIADLLDINLNTVRSRLARGRARAQALMLERSGPGPGDDAVS